MTIRRFAVMTAAALLMFSSAASGDRAERSPSTAADPNVTAAKKAIDSKDWKQAIALLDKAKPNADVHNYLGYAYRNIGDYQRAFQHYGRALELDSRHRGAHEYIGEAYLLTDNPAKAEEHLAALNRICGTRCEEYRDLARGIADYRKKRSQ